MARRKAEAERLYARRFTMEDIAAMLGVSHQTIGRDLGDLSTTDKSKPTKTATNPRGAGRPKGSKNEDKDKQQTRKRTNGGTATGNGASVARTTFILRADAAGRMAKYDGRATRKVYEAARWAADAWTTLADNLERRIK
jgi:predicted ArsR family transcriptional regulator